MIWLSNFAVSQICCQGGFNEKMFALFTMPAGNVRSHFINSPPFSNDDRLQ